MDSNTKLNINLLFNNPEVEQASLVHKPMSVVVIIDLEDLAIKSSLTLVLAQ